ncbi:MAG: KR domain-containing protein, partial [Rhodospirillaceae bacterium]
ADEATVRAALAAADLPGIGIAAVNGPQATVISGAAAAVAEVGELLKAKGGTVTALKVSHAFHSPLMQPIMDEFRHGAASIPAAAPGILWVSTLTGQAMTAAPDADYWCDHALQAVRFADGVRTLAANGITDFIEIGPGKALLTLAQTSVQGAGLSWTATLGRDGDAWRELLETVGTLYRRGQAIDWAGFDAPYPRQRLALPTYPFQRDSFWADSSDTTAPVRAKPPAPSTGLLGPRIRSPLADLQFDMPYSRTQYSWIDDHLVYGLTVLPTTAGLVALLEAAQSHFGDPDLAITDLSYLDALVIGAKEERTVQVILTPLDDTRLDFRLVSCGTETDAPWRTHMTGSIRRSTPSSVSAFDFEHAKRTYARTLEAPAFYAGLKGIGLAYGPTFRGVRTLWRNDNECIAHVRLPDAVADISTDRLHPALLDACLHVYPAIIEAYGLLERTEIPPEGTYLPVGIERFSLIPGTAREVWVHCRRRPLGGDSGITVDIDVYCTKGRRLAGFEGLSLKPLPPALFSSAAPQVKPADDWLYQVRWDERPVAIPATDAPTSWLILADRGNTGAALADELRAKGHEVRILERKQISDNEKLLIPTLTALAKKSQDKTCGLVYLWGLDAAGPAIDPADEAQQRLIFGNALLLAQAIAETQTRFTVPPRLWLVTRNAVPATGSEPPLSILQAGLWGFGRSLALEQPRTKGGLIDLEGSPADAAALAAELLSGDGEDQVALRGGRRLAARFVRAPLPSVVSKPAGDGTWLVTGGLGALGVVTARWLIERRGVRNLVLVSRRGAADPAAKSIKAELEALGAKIKVAKADTGNEDDVKKLLLSLRKSLKGIYHSAGILDDATVPQMDWARFRRAVVPKIDAGWFLHRHSEGINLEEFVLYSSILSLTGSAGQVNYTAGNASLDALATHRRRLGLPALSLNWGPWAESGLAAQLGDRGEAIWRARGLIFLPPEIGTQALDALSTSGLDHAAILLADWPAVLRQFTTPPPFYAEFQTANDSESADSDAGDDLETLRDRLASSAPGERRGAIIAFVSRQVAGTLGMVGEVDPSQPLRELGLDSLMAITLINRIDAALGIRIPAVKLLQGPSIDQLVDDIWPDLKGIAATTGKTGAPAPAAPLRRLSEEIRVAPPSSFAPAFAPETPSAAKSNGSDKNNGTHTLTYSPWLVPIGKRVNPRLRLFCFPFVGGGSAVFRDWGNMIDPSIEVVAIEPPGRLARITEQPVSNMDEFVESVVEAMLPALDRPFALFGHCLGGLTMFEVARTLIEETSHRPNHLFCSGARSPDRVHEIGRFEKRLGRHLIKMKGFRTDLPPYQQPDRVFAEMLRHFDMAATDQFLDDPELRKLMMPAVRAEFEMTNTYHFEWDEPWDIPITCFVSKGDPYVSREDILGWGRFTNNRLQVYMRKGTHYSVFEDAKFINEIINREAFTSTE